MRRCTTLRLPPPPLFLRRCTTTTPHRLQPATTTTTTCAFLLPLLPPLAAGFFPLARPGIAQSPSNTYEHTHTWAAADSKSTAAAVLADGGRDTTPAKSCGDGGGDAQVDQLLQLCVEHEAAAAAEPCIRQESGAARRV